MGRIGISHRYVKKPSKLSADERAFLNRIRSLNEEETEKLTWEEMIAYLNIMHKIDPRSLRNAFEESFIDRGSGCSQNQHIYPPRPDELKEKCCKHHRDPTYSH
jgi:hypothetical protein